MDAAFGKIVRAEDREQARVNELKRLKYWSTRGRALESVYTKKQKKDIAEGNRYEDL